MSWLISKALMAAYENSPCLQAPEAGFLAESCSDGAPSAPSSGESTPLAYCAPDKMKAFSRLSRFGTTLKLLTESRGAELLTWYLAASRARTSASPEKAQESPESGPGCGPTWRGSLARFDRDSLSWKTVQHSLLGDSEPSSVIWPRSGMTAAGQCWELPMLGRTTSATASGWWPTPLANSHTGAGHGPNKTGAPNLQTAVKKFPTPAARDYRSPNKLSYEERGGGKKGEQLPNAVGGRLNPTWTEWLMGFPQGWTELRRSEMPRFPSVLQPHGDCFEEIND